MKYKDLVEFDPIISVKVLREADDPVKARQDVRTFVISQRMREQLRDIILPNLQFDTPRDNKGLLVVANYGTGKTHMMSVIAAIAEHEDLVESLTNKEVQQDFQPIAGHFKVVRAEIGATQMSLRDIVCKELEGGLAKLGVIFSFPSAAEVTNTKDSLVEMMQAFEGRFPDKGLLFALDELLDYLRRRRDTELIQDLTFLREAGEICRSTRFRFVAGIQEAIFDNPRFAGVADAVKRVKDRFEQVRISREDVAYVVKERLLRKKTAQKDMIRDHLRAFTPLYEGMAEGLEDFVALFPVHPAYLRTFEQIKAVEKRDVLKTLSQEMNRLLDREVPEGEPGLICYDSYRARLVEDPVNRQVPEIREVLDKTDVLRNRVEKGIPSRQYAPTAIRIIDALAVHRLTTDDIYVPLGPTRAELRDDLCLLPPNLPERDSFFLGTTVDAIIGEIMKAVSGQFISENTENGQIYLDVRKDIDYDQKIDDRAGSLDEERLDEAYFKALEELLERRDAPYVSGYRIWEYELAWVDRNVTRFGYLFMGAPNERSTAQPPRDFYIYFLQPYAPPPFVDEEKADEVFFRLERPDDEFTQWLRKYAGATALAIESSATHRGVYVDKAQRALQEMVKWLRRRMAEAITVTHRGEALTLATWLAKTSGPRASIKDQVDTIAAGGLTSHFAERYPDYPKFLASVTRSNFAETVRQALIQVATGRPTNLSAKILESLNLVDIRGQTVDKGPFAQYLLNRLLDSNGRAVNRSEILTERDPGVYTWGPWHLEVGWLLVVAGTLTQLGRMEIGFATGQVDALGLDRLTRLSLDELENFSNLNSPKPIPLILIREVAKLLGLPQGIVADQGINEVGVLQLLKEANEMVIRVVEARAEIQNGISVWGAAVIEQLEEKSVKLEALQRVLENVKARNTVGKMNRLDTNTALLEDANAGLTILRSLEASRTAANRLAETIAYLREATEVFGEGYPLSEESKKLREEIVAMFRSQEELEAGKVTGLRNAGEDLRRRFSEEAARAHERDRLDVAGDDRKRQILEGDDFKDLHQLSAVSLLPSGAFGSLQNRLLSVGTCKTFDEQKLKDSVICPACSYRPRSATGPTAKALVADVAREMGKLRTDWTRTLTDNLGTPEMSEQIELLKPRDKDAIKSFLAKGELPTQISDAFVKALNQVFERFEVRRITSQEVWLALFPEQSPVSLSELEGRFRQFLLAQRNGASEDKIRIIPTDASNEAGASR